MNTEADNDEYAYNFFMKCVKSGKIINDEPIEVLYKSIDDVDYTRVECVEYILPDEQQLTELETLSDATQNETKLKVTYNYQGEFYEVMESNEIHSKLQTDENFFAEFFQIEKAIEKNIVQDNLDESYCSQTNPHHTMPAQEVLNEIPKKDENDSKFAWDRKSILFLLSKYSERLAKFRSPSIKKLTLWREIEKEFHKIGILQVNAQMIDNKFCYMKAKYKNIKNNNKKTGHGRQTWEWYQQIAEILENDKSVNFDTGIASMDNEPVDLLQRRISSAYRLSSTLMSPFQNFYNYNFTYFSSHIRSSSSSSDAFSDSDAEASTDAFFSSHLDADDCSNSMPIGDPTSPGSAQSLTFSSSSSESKTRKSTRAKSLYSQRNKALQKESSKIDILRSIENKYDRVLQQKSSKIGILRELLQRKNEILEKRNELLESLIEKRNNMT